MRNEKCYDGLGKNANDKGGATMAQSAYIYLVNGSAAPTITLDELKEHLDRYKEQTALTGKQLGWDYAASAFPYSIETKPEGQGKWFYLKGRDPQYNYILMGVGTKAEEDGEKGYIQVTLPDDATHGDKSKGNELCKYLAKKLKAELKLFNGRTMYFNPRK
jgi:hypothetical protein